MSEYSPDVRRKDRQNTDDGFVKEVLRRSASCSLSVEKEGFPLIHNTFFVYDEPQNEIIFHFSKYGHAGKEISNGKKTCISLYRYGKLYTSKKATDFGCEYQSVIAYGRIRIVENEQERLKAMEMFFNKFFQHIPASEYEPFTSSEAKPIYVTKIKIEQWFGKEHLLPDHAVKSFYYPDKAMI